MTALATRSPVSARKDARQLTPTRERKRVAPIVAAIDGSPAGWNASDAAVRLAIELNAPLTFVYVRRGPAGFLGTPVFERRLARKMAKARRVIDHALRDAARVGVAAEGEILEGSPAKRIVEFARDRSARLIVIGSRRRWLGRSVSCAILRASREPVLVARGANSADLRPGVFPRASVRRRRERAGSPAPRGRPGSPRDVPAGRGSRGQHPCRPAQAPRLVGALTVGANDELEVVLKGLIAEHAPTGAPQLELVGGTSE